MDKINLEFIRKQTKRDAGLPLQTAEDFAKAAAKEVLEDLDALVQTELDIEPDDFKSMLSDDVTAQAVLEGVGSRLLALMDSNGGYKPSEPESIAIDSDDEIEALKGVTRIHAGMRRSKIKG